MQITPPSMPTLRRFSQEGPKVFREPCLQLVGELMQKFLPILDTLTRLEPDSAPTLSSRVFSFMRRADAASKDMQKQLLVNSFLHNLIGAKIHLAAHAAIMDGSPSPVQDLEAALIEVDSLFDAILESPDIASDLQRALKQSQIGAESQLTSCLQQFKRIEPTTHIGVQEIPIAQQSAEIRDFRTFTDAEKTLGRHTRSMDQGVLAEFLGLILFGSLWFRNETMSDIANLGQIRLVLPIARNPDQEVLSKTRAQLVEVFKQVRSSMPTEVRRFAADALEKYRLYTRDTVARQLLPNILPAALIELAEQKRMREGKILGLQIIIECNQAGVCNPVAAS